MTRFDFNIRLALYDGEGENGAEGAGAASGSPPANPPKVLTLTQEEFDRKITDRLKKERAERQAEKQTYITRLEELQRSSTMTAEEKATLEQQIEELRVSNLTKEEQARHAKEKAEKEWESKHKTAQEEAVTWKTRHDALLVSDSITKAAAEHKALPQALPFLSAHLAPKTRLVEVKDDEGKATGRYETRVRMPSVDKDKKPIELDLSVAEAVKLMRETPDDYGMLFEGTKIGGAGANSGKPAGKIDVDNLDLDSYRKNLKPRLMA